MNKKKRKVIAIVVLTSLLCISWLACNNYELEYSFLPVGFYVVSVLLLLLYNSLYNLTKGNNFHLLLIYKIFRILASVVMLIAGVKTMPDNKSEFVLLFMAFYLVYLIYDSVFLYKMGEKEKV